MQTYIGTKILNAKPMTRGDYNKLRGWTLPADENGEDEGYLTDNGAGHLQWQPKAVFEDAFDPCDAMTFGLAIEALKKGKRVARAGWNGKGLCLELQRPDECSKFTFPYIFMAYPSSDTAPQTYDCGRAWLVSQTDMLAEDWQIVE